MPETPLGLYKAEKFCCNLGKNIYAIYFFLYRENVLCTLTLKKVV